MPQVPSRASYLLIGQISCRAVFALGVAYLITTGLGILSLDSPQEPISSPYLTIMEVLILLIAPLMTISMASVHFWVSRADKIYSLMALFFIFLMTGLTSSIHFMVLSIGPHLKEDQLPGNLFTWPSPVYALDVLAWDWVFGLSMLFAAPVFKKRNVRALIRVSGWLSLVGLIGIPLQNMQVRNIGIVGYGIVGPLVFLKIGKMLRQPK